MTGLDDLFDEVVDSESRQVPEEGLTQVVEYSIEVKIDGQTFRKKFNVDPRQDVQGHVERWIHELNKLLEASQ